MLNIIKIFVLFFLSQSFCSEKKEKLLNVVAASAGFYLLSSTIPFKRMPFQLWGKFNYRNKLQAIPLAFTDILSASVLGYRLFKLFNQDRFTKKTGDLKEKKLSVIEEALPIDQSVVSSAPSAAGVSAKIKGYPVLPDNWESLDSDQQDLFLQQYENYDNFKDIIFGIDFNDFNDAEKYHYLLNSSLFGVLGKNKKKNKDKIDQQKFDEIIKKSTSLFYEKNKDDQTFFADSGILELVKKHILSSIDFILPDNKDTLPSGGLAPGVIDMRWFHKWSIRKEKLPVFGVQENYTAMAGINELSDRFFSPYFIIAVIMPGNEIVDPAGGNKKTDEVLASLHCTYYDGKVMNEEIDFGKNGVLKTKGSEESLCISIPSQNIYCQHVQYLNHIFSQLITWGKKYKCLKIVLSNLDGRQELVSWVAENISGAKIVKETSLKQGVAVHSPSGISFNNTVVTKSLVITISNKTKIKDPVFMVTEPTIIENITYWSDSIDEANLEI